LIEKLNFHSRGVESKLGTLGTSASNWPIVPAPGECEDGEFGGIKIGMGNRSAQRKPAPTHFVHHKSHLTRPGLEPRLTWWETSD
jgi:hypothetical protein